MFRKAMRFIKEKGAKIARTAAVIGTQKAIRKLGKQIQIWVDKSRRRKNTVATKGLKTFAAIHRNCRISNWPAWLFTIMSIGQLVRWIQPEKKKVQHGLVAVSDVKS